MVGVYLALVSSACIKVSSSLADLELRDIWLIVVDRHRHARLLVLLVGLGSYLTRLHASLLLRGSTNLLIEVTRTFGHLDGFGRGHLAQVALRVGAMLG